MNQRLLFLGVFLASILPAGAQDPAIITPHITVTGTVTTEVKPDQLNWTAEVRNTGPDVAKVADKHSAATGALLTLLKQQGIEDKHVQTTQVELGPNMVYRHNESVQEGYYAATTVSFKLTDMARYKDLWIKLASQGGVSVKGVNFDHSKRVEITKETRIKALRAAKEKAVDMAAALDAKVGTVLAISEDPFQHSLLYANNSPSNSVQRVQQRAGDGGDDGTDLAPGTIPIQARVIVTFKLLGEAK